MTNAAAKANVKQEDPAARLSGGHRLLTGVSLLLLICIGFLVTSLSSHRLSGYSLTASREAAQGRAIEFYTREYVSEIGAHDREALRDAISLLRVSHEFLTGSGAENAGDAMPESVRRIYYEGPYNLDSLVRDYIGHAEALLQIPERSLKKNNPHYEFITAKAATLQRGLEAAVENYDFEDQRLAERYTYYSLFALLMLLATWIGEGLMVVRPLLVLARREVPGYSDFTLVDRLTGLDNLACIAKKGDKHAHASMRHDRPLSLCVINLDNFGAMIGRNGPEAADAVLKSVADLLFRAIRAEDELARIDDDEFALLLPFTKLEQAHHMADRLRMLIEKTAMACKSESALFITVSIGIAELDPGLPQFETLLASARDALGHAKLEGRNRVSVAERKAYNIRLVSNVDHPVL